MGPRGWLSPAYATKLAEARRIGEKETMACEAGGSRHILRYILDDCPRDPVPEFGLADRTHGMAIMYVVLLAARLSPYSLTGSPTWTTWQLSSRLTSFDIPGAPPATSLYPCHSSCMQYSPRHRAYTFLLEHMGLEGRWLHSDTFNGDQDDEER